MTTSRRSDLGALHPIARDAFERLAAELEATTIFRVFETYRSPEDQQKALARGVSKAKPWQSAHQYGLAVDFVPYGADGWTWEVPVAMWLQLATRAPRYGLICPIKWDKPHVEHPAFGAVRKAFK